jgi:hypothetical protein
MVLRLGLGLWLIKPTLLIAIVYVRASVSTENKAKQQCKQTTEQQQRPPKDNSRKTLIQIEETTKLEEKKGHTHSRVAAHQP